MKQATASLRKQYVKAWIKLLTQAAEKVDGYLFEESEDESEVRPYFYATIAFGIIITLLILWRTV